MPFEILDHVFGTQSKVRVLRALATLDSPVSGREAQRLAGVSSVSGVGRALDDLSDIGIIDREETSGTHLYRMNREHALAAAIVGLFEAEQRVWAKLREMLRAALKAADLGVAVRSVIVFGSFARGIPRPDSDLDLLLIVQNEDAVARVRDVLLELAPSIRARLGLRASPYVLSQARAVARHAEGDPLMEAIEADGRTLLGDSFQEAVSVW